MSSASNIDVTIIFLQIRLNKLLDCVIELEFNPK